MLFMYSIASLPFAYSFSFCHNSELVGPINFLLLNALMCFIDMLFAFGNVFSQNTNKSNLGQMTKTSRIFNILRWILSACFPTVNLKHGLFNIRLHSDNNCISTLNSLMGTNFKLNEPWMSLHQPAIGIQFTIFIAQFIVWWIIIFIIEGGFHYFQCRKKVIRKDTNLSMETTLNSTVRISLFYFSHVKYDNLYRNLGMMFEKNEKSFYKIKTWKILQLLLYEILFDNSKNEEKIHSDQMNIQLLIILISMFHNDHVLVYWVNIFLCQFSFIVK